jgi:hypothetical protein
MVVACASSAPVLGAIGLASADDAMRERTLGLLSRAEDASRARARLATQSLLELAPRLRRRATLTAQHVPVSVLAALNRDASVVRTGSSTAMPYGWDELADGEPWTLDAYRVEALRELQAYLARAGSATRSKPVLLRAMTDCGRSPRTTNLRRSRWPRLTCSTTRTSRLVAAGTRC